MNCETLIGVVQEKLNNIGLLVTAPSTSVYGREKSYNFLHRTLQGFCTAWYISKLPLQDQIHTNWDSYRHTMVMRFYSGITGLRNCEVLNSVLPSKLVKRSYCDRTVPLLMHCVYEAQNARLCQVIGDHLDGCFDVTGNIEVCL